MAWPLHVGRLLSDADPEDVQGRYRSRPGRLRRRPALTTFTLAWASLTTTRRMWGPRQLPGRPQRHARADHVHVGGAGLGNGRNGCSPVSGDGSAGDPVTVENQAIGHLKIGSTVAGVDQAAGRILEADGAGDVRWADQRRRQAVGAAPTIRRLPRSRSMRPDFTGNLGTGDDDVQAALDTIDAFELENTFRGAYNSNRTYDGGEMVIYQGLEYISLIRENDREPTRSEEQWSAQPRGYIYRGDAPVAATTYQEAHIVRVPAQDSYYICTFQGGVSVTRAQLAAGHANFHPLAHRLTDAQVASSTSGEKGTISGEQLHDFAPELGIAEATSKVSDEFGRVSGRRIGEAIDAHVVPSTNATTDIGEDSVIGTSAELSRDDHAHELPIDNTLEFNTDDELGVNVTDVVETLQERIRHFTTTGNYSSDAGASVGQAFNLGPHRTRITKVQFDFAPLAGADSFLVRLEELESNNEIKAKLHTSNTRLNSALSIGGGPRTFNFHDADGELGVIVDRGIRLGILLSRLGDDSDSAVQAIHGSEDSDSPSETYDDASTDFALDGGIVYQHINPAIGASTHSHDSMIRGNIKIFYTVIIDHGYLVGDGQVNAAHIDSGSSADGEVLTSDGSGGADWEAAAGVARVPTMGGDATGFTGNLHGGDGP